MTEKEFLERFEFCFDTLFDGEEEFDAALRYACFGGASVCVLSACSSGRPR